MKVSILSDVIAVSTGSFHSVALKADGTLWSWGSNSYGQLGDGTNTSWVSPTKVSGATAITAVTAGASHTVALQKNGTLWAWGHNTDGALGDGTTTGRLTPVAVTHFAQ